MTFFGQIAIDRRYRLRWRFDFAGKASKMGIWNNNGGRQDEGFGSAAWCVNKTGLVRAVIEGEACDEATGSWGGVAVPLVECDGWDFVNFWWRAATPAPFMLGSASSLEIAGQIVGLTLETREEKKTVYVDGTFKTTAKTLSDKSIHLAGFGK